jgi:hypothetical protein
MTGDVTYFKRIMGKDKRYEVSLEPCLNGFDVALYRIDERNIRNLEGKKYCTEMEGYGEDYFGSLKRDFATWSKALKIADVLVINFTEGTYDNVK